MRVVGKRYLCCIPKHGEDNVYGPGLLCARMLWDVFCDRGSTFPLLISELHDSLIQNRRIANLVSEDDVFVRLGHGICHGDAICFLAEVSFRVR